MQVGEVVQFQERHFFDGAVQLGWVQQQPELAAEVAGAFVFHGPRYHGSNDAGDDEFSSAYRLKDSASFVRDLLATAAAAHDGEGAHPFWLAIAGYGSGKSHLSVTLAELLGVPDSPASARILARLEEADTEIAGEVRQLLVRLDRPMLVLPIDGSGRFHLGNALSQSVFNQLAKAGIDADPIRALSPRFETAEHFVEHNFAFRSADFAKRLPGTSAEDIRSALQRQEEDTFDAVNAIYLEANGHPIPIEGLESAQALLETLSTQYCGSDGPFSHVVILFDELGLYLEYAAEHPERAGARALQEIFQGVQDNAARIQFVGFIQYELKSYLQHFSTADLRHLQRYLTRFDAAEKCYLSSNLETLFAHMIHKDEAALDALWSATGNDGPLHQTWQRLSLALPDFANLPLWREEARFAQVIGRGCWPLHPLAVWLLTRQNDLIQQRSALAFVKQVMAELAPRDALVDGRLRYVSAADLLHDFLLEQYAASDRTPGGLIETLLQLLERHHALLDRPTRLVMSAVAVLDKVRVGRQARETVDHLLAEATALPPATIEHALDGLAGLGALEWNSDLEQYELLSDGASRGQFQQWLRAQRRQLGREDVRQLFLRRGIKDCELMNPISSDFGKRFQISTADWAFEAATANVDTIASAIARAAVDWRRATLPDTPKGKVIYLYLDDQDDLIALDERIRHACAQALKGAGTAVAPIWIIGLMDTHGYLADALARLTVIEERVGDAERERYRRFLDDELGATRSRLKKASDDAILARRYWVAGWQEPPTLALRRAALEIFSRVYPQVVAFPFDGFSTSRGNGPRDVGALAKALATHQVNSVWIPSQAASLRNRVGAVLRDGWQALDRENEPREPRDDPLKGVFHALQEAHRADPSRRLLTSYRWLIAAPRGMNAASATLLLSLMIGLRSPQRGLVFEGEPVGNPDWIARAFPAIKAKHYFDEAVLAKTTLRFFDEDAQARWKGLLDAWEAETRWDRIVQRANEAEILLAAEPVPPSLDGRLRFLRKASEEARGQLLEMDLRFKKWQREIERAVKEASVEHCLRFGHEIAGTREEIDGSDRWPQTLLHECDGLLGYAREVIAAGVSGWIRRQGIHNVAQAAEFRNRTEAQTRWLNELGFRREAALLQQQAGRSLLQVEQRQKHALTLDAAADYPRQPAPRDGEPMVRLKAEAQKGFEIIHSLQAIGILDQEEKAAHVQRIEQRVTRIREVIQRQKALFEGVYERALQSEADVRELGATIERLRAIFAGDGGNEGEINDLAAQLARIGQDIAAWEGTDLPPERLQAVLSSQAEHQLGDFAAFVDASEMDPPPWDIAKLYRGLIEERVALARRRSEEWTRPRTVLEDKVSTLDANRARALQAELENAPAYLADSDRTRIGQLREAVDSRIRVLAEEERRARIVAWKAGFPPVTGLALLDRATIETLIGGLDAPPAPLTAEDEHWRSTLADGLTGRLDEMSLDDLVNRIERLPPVLKSRLFARLSVRPGT